MAPLFLDSENSEVSQPHSWNTAILCNTAILENMRLITHPQQSRLSQVHAVRLQAMRLPSGEEAQGEEQTMSGNLCVDRGRPAVS